MSELFSWPKMKRFIRLRDTAIHAKPQIAKETQETQEINSVKIKELIKIIEDILNLLEKDKLSSKEMKSKKQNFAEAKKLTKKYISNLDKS
ncbi:MAG: hypothetical protein KJ718_04415 [Nanoarchaeota archaeon]|nr:hypothetical protein [Nanoarchaeota archaeon]MBU1051773.1 hypothetical protein [Nanoarchaeota archaeon]MBU1988346.1 hypothetical protein [Nanoarchaeota archaeon]